MRFRRKALFADLRLHFLSQKYFVGFSLPTTTRKRGAADDTIALFQDGKLKSGALMSVITDKLTQYDKEFADHTDKLTKYDKEFDDHLKNYNNFRKSVVHK